MPDYLMVGYKQIHRELFCDKEGNAVISLDTLERKYGPDMKAKGVVWDWVLGRGKGRRLRNIVGWQSIIQNYFIRRHQRLWERMQENLTSLNPPL